MCDKLSLQIFLCQQLVAIVEMIAGIKLAYSYIRINQ